MAAVRPPSAVPPTILPSVCPLDCPDACSLEVHVEGDRVVAVGGSHINPVTAGYICSKVRRLPEHVHGERRVRYPAMREGRKGEGRFRRVSWDEALDTIAARMTELVRRGDAERILPFYYGGSNGYLSQNTSDLRLFERLGASRLARTVCAAPSGSAAAGLYGTMPGMALQDYRHSRLIVLWGVNPSVSGIHLVPSVLDAQSRGARLVVVDPRRTRLAERADLHIAPHPGTDLVLALAILRWLFENGRADEAFLAAHATGAEELRRRAAPWTLEEAARTARVPAEDIENLARMYADSSPAALRCGWGLERNRNGGSAVAAVLALPAGAGKVGGRGGGYTLGNSEGGRRLHVEHREGGGSRCPARRGGASDDLRAGSQHEPAGQDAPGRQRISRRPALRLQRESACDDPESGKGARGALAGRPLHCRLRPGRHRYGALRGRSAAGDDVPRAGRDVARVRGDGPAGVDARHPSRRGVASEP